MSGHFLRRALGVPAPFTRGMQGRHQADWLPPDQRQLSLEHPTGWLASDALLNSYDCSLGQVHYRRSGTTAFAVGTQGLSADLLARWARSMRAEKIRQTLIFPVPQWDRMALVDRGFDLMLIGQEAEVYLPTYDSEGPARANLRQMLGRAKRQGLELRFSQHLQPTEAELFSGWLKSRPQPQPMGLLVGTDLGSSKALYACVYDPSGQCVAWVQARSGYRQQGFGIDAMVRSPQAPAGAMELAIDGLLKRRRSCGDRWFSLGAVPLRGVAFERPVLGPICIALRQTQVGNLLFGFSGLGSFKAKFAPRWRPLYLGAYGRLGATSLYEGCRLWGLF
jgi:lysylphosphatidylglycerol synthetase-like protein (DUF2156 family)